MNLNVKGQYNIMKNIIKIILIITVLLFPVIGCSISNNNITSDNISYGENSDGAAIFGPCIKCAEKTYVLDGSISKLPTDSEFLGKSSESNNEVLDGIKIANVSAIDQNKFSDIMYAITITPNSNFYISSSQKSIYCERNGIYDIYVIQ